MNFGFLSNISWFWDQSNKGFVSLSRPMNTIIEKQTKTLIDVKLWGWSLLSIVKIETPSILNRKLKRQNQHRSVVESSAELTRVRFRPYVSKVPWHGGARGFLSQLFPRYGHYCGPNWSSGKDGGSLVWDKRPIDWLDYCCYCHDIGYDSHDQATLLKADLAFLECLERPQMATRGDARVAQMYKTMCTTGLRNILIPYRRNLVNLRPGQSFMSFGWMSNMKWMNWNPWKNTKS